MEFPYDRSHAGSSGKISEKARKIEHFMRVMSCLLWVFMMIAAPRAWAEPTEVAVSFIGARDAKLAGTLTLPSAKADQRFPALLLLQGSGPTDRDGNQLPMIRTDLLKQLADALSEIGVATLRFDKRGMHAN